MRSSMVMITAERRRHVRVKPTPELPARVVLGDGPVRESLDVVDVSLGGFALSSPALRSTQAGARLALTLALGTGREHAIDVVARWAKAEVVGVELVEPAQEVTESLRRYVAELLERGGAS
ncbi:MAG: PilZ domain-containing protein [Labilithrix sp.]|nr:PilZ domain-containing protein [Labilithrix sp.]